MSGAPAPGCASYVRAVFGASRGPGFHRPRSTPRPRPFAAVLPASAPPIPQALAKPYRRPRRRAWRGRAG